MNALPWLCGLSFRPSLWRDLGWRGSELGTCGQGCPRTEVHPCPQLQCGFPPPPAPLSTRPGGEGVRTAQISLERGATHLVRVHPCPQVPPKPFEEPSLWMPLVGCAGCHSGRRCGGTEAGAGVNWGRAGRDARGPKMPRGPQSFPDRNVSRTEDAWRTEMPRGPKMPPRPKMPRGVRRRVGWEAAALGEIDVGG